MERGRINLPAHHQSQGKVRAKNDGGVGQQKRKLSLNRAVGGVSSDGAVGGEDEVAREGKKSTSKPCRKRRLQPERDEYTYIARHLGENLPPLERTKGYPLRPPRPVTKPAKPAVPLRRKKERSNNNQWGGRRLPGETLDIRKLRS